MPPVDTFSPWVVAIAASGVIGFVAWTIASVIKGKDDLHKLELSVSRDYVKRDDFAELRREFKQMRVLMHDVAIKLGISIRGE